MSFIPDEKSLEERKNEVSRLLKKYPNRVPVFLNKNKSSKDIQLHRQKFLVPNELTVGQLLYMIRKQIKLLPEQALYLFFNNHLVNSNTTLIEVYHTYRAPDDMLYGVYSIENTFG